MHVNLLSTTANDTPEKTTMQATTPLKTVYIKKDQRPKSHLCAKIPIELHDAVRKEQFESGLWLTDLIEQILIEHFSNKQKVGKPMENTRTLALQISEELFNRLKAYIEKTPKLTQKAFITELITKALDDAEVA